MPLIFIEKVPQKERAFVESKIHSICVNLGIPDDDWLSIVINRESNWNPKARPIKNGVRISTATGLIQFLEGTAAGLGTSTNMLYNMTVSQQLPFVEAYLKGQIKTYGKPKSCYQLYLLVHYPSKSKALPNETIYASPSSAYNANIGLDKAKKGRVIGEDITVFLASSLPVGYDKKRLNNPISSGILQTTGISTTTLLYGLAVIILGLFVSYPTYFLDKIKYVGQIIKGFTSKPKLS